MRTTSWINTVIKTSCPCSKPETRADGLLLRLALAEQALDLPAFRNHAAELAACFAAGRERGTMVHVREEARFTLALLRHDAQKSAGIGPGQLEGPAGTSGRQDSPRMRARRQEPCRRPSRCSIGCRTNHVEDFQLRQLAKEIQEGTF